MPSKALIEAAKAFHARHRYPAFGIRGDSAVTRERRTLRARYRLVDLKTGEVVLDATAGSDAGIDIVSSEYATVAAEQTAQHGPTMFQIAASAKF